MSLYDVFSILEEWAPVDTTIQAPTIEEHLALEKRLFRNGR